MNYMLDFTIYLGPNAIMTAGLSSHKFRLIYYFKIVHYGEDGSLIDDQDKSLNVDILRMVLTASN